MPALTAWAFHPGFSRSHSALRLVTASGGDHREMRSGFARIENECHRAMKRIAAPFCSSWIGNVAGSPGCQVVISHK